jgi:acetyltransferase-like isoleucine patch superfamily enzyme
MPATYRRSRASAGGVLFGFRALWQEWRHLLRIHRLGATFGCEISPKARFTGPDDAIEIGAGTVINAYCNIRFRSGRVAIGRNVLFAQNVTLLANTHRYKDRAAPILAQGVEVGDVTIGDDVWLGVNAVVMPGVRIGSGAVIGANAVVTRDVGAYEVWAGNPAVKINARE